MVPLHSRPKRPVRVIQLPFVREHMRIGTRCRHQVVVANELTDSRSRSAGEVEQRHAPVAQVVRREQRRPAELFPD